MNRDWMDGRRSGKRDDSVRKSKTAQDSPRGTQETQPERLCHTAAGYWREGQDDPRCAV